MRQLTIAFLIISCVKLAAQENGGEVMKEIPSPYKGVPALIIPLQKEVEASTEEGPDFALFHLQKNGGANVSASMTIYVGYFPPRLFDSIKEADFVDQQPAQFVYERAAWFVWLPTVDGNKTVAAKAYLYNVFKHRSGFIVVVSINGDYKENVDAFKRSAERMVFKGLEKGPVAKKKR